jgi:hypothetical protein
MTIQLGAETSALNKLPNDIQALSFVCRSFGIGRDELDLTLKRMREITPQSEKYFPPNLWRETVKRAKKDKDLWQDAAKIVHREAAYDLICRQSGKPLWSFTGKIADEFVSVLLSLYARLLPKLDVEGVSKTDALWLLVENVFVPTVYAKLVQEWRHGLGNEFLGEICWYLPIKSHGQIEKPFPRVLNYWMRVAGFQTTYQIAKAAGEIPLRRKIDRWLNGETPPDPPVLHKLVNQFADNISWLDEPDTWKARLTLACAMQNVCDLMDEYFKPIQIDSSLALSEMFKRISKERIVCDDNKFLAASHSFFASRLLQLRWQKKGKWQPDPLDTGNWFLETIRKMAVADGYVESSKPHVTNYVMLEEYLFGLGVSELNHILASQKKRGRRATARRP